MEIPRSSEPLTSINQPRDPATPSQNENITICGAGAVTSGPTNEKYTDSIRKISHSENISDDLEPGIPLEMADSKMKVHASIHGNVYSKKQKFSGLTLFWLAYQSIGVIYGDIGTSPLYVYSSTFSSDPSKQDLVGALSLILWTMAIIVTLKYAIIVLLADDDGEGGTFALFALLSRYANISANDPKTGKTLSLQRYRTNDLQPVNRSFRSVLERSGAAKLLLKFLAIIGICFIMADGILTPAQSVLGAIQGLKVVRPEITTSVIIGVSCAILILLFMIQPFGTTKIGSTFAPIVIIWLLLNSVSGIFNLVKRDHTVLKAFSPHYAVDYLKRNGETGWRSLGGILLSFTGVEALYANLGAFNLASIRISWLAFGWPALMLAYIGQAAYMSDIPSAYSNPFFNTLPPGTFWFGMVFAILAAIVASQAMITATFQLLSQVMSASYFPKLKLKHTSDKFFGQIYIPVANWVLMVGAVIVTAVYHDTTKLGHAYGTCVIMVTLITTCMVSITALIVWRLHILIVILGFLVFGAVEGLYFSSAITKFPDGAWFTVLIAGVLASILFIWRHGKESQWRSERDDIFPLSQLLATNEAGEVILRRLARRGRTPHIGSAGALSKVKGIGVFFDKAGLHCPTITMHFLQKFQATHTLTVFFHLHPVPVPTVAPEEQFNIIRLSAPSTYRMIVRHGYSEHIITANLSGLIFAKLAEFIGSNPAPERVSPSVELETLRQAYNEQVIYIVGKEQLRVVSPRERNGGVFAGFWQSFVLMMFAWLRDVTRSKVAEMNIPVDQLVEVGFVKEI